MADYADEDDLRVMELEALMADQNAQIERLLANNDSYVESRAQDAREYAERNVMLNDHHAENVAATDRQTAVLTRIAEALEKLAVK